MSTSQEAKFKEIQAKNQKIAENAVRINTQIENAQETYEKLKTAAIKKFSESDIEKLKSMRTSWLEENDRKLKEWEEKTNQKEAEVAAKGQLIKQIQQN